MPAGSVYVFNPTSSDYNIFVNGQTALSLPGTTGSLKWVAGTTTNPVARNEQGNPNDKQFGWNNHIRVSLVAGGGADAQFDLDIPHEYQISNDLQLYIFYDEDFQQATYVALSQGEVFAKGGLQKA
jgi:hypothetical protein